MINVQESQGVITISGAYNELAPHLAVLKRLKFRWDPYQKTWTLLTPTPKARQALADLFGSKPKGVPIDPAKAIQILKEWERSRPVYWSGKMGVRFDDGLTLTAQIPDVVRQVLIDAGGSYNPGLAILDPKKINVAKLPDLIEYLNRWGADRQLEIDRVRQVAKATEQGIREVVKATKIPQHVSLAPLTGYAMLTGVPAPYRDQVKRLFPDATWSTGHWQLPYTSVKAFVDLLDLLQTIPAPVTVTRIRKDIVNRRPGLCDSCPRPVAAGEGVAFEVFDGDGGQSRPNTDEMVWVVAHMGCRGK